MKQLERDGERRVTNTDHDVVSASFNSEPDYAVVKDNAHLHSTGNYDYVKCPAYNYVPNK